MMASIMIPKELSAIYSYKIISKLGLLDTYAAMILPQLGEAIGVFLLYNFFCTIPKEFRESCELDGGGHMTALWRIYLPMAGPGSIRRCPRSSRGWCSTGAAGI